MSSLSPHILLTRMTTVACLPLEIWENVLQYCEEQELLPLRAVSSAWQKHIEDRIIPARLIDANYEIPSVSMLLFNGFHSYRSNQRLKYREVMRRVYHPYSNITADYARFQIIDPLRYFKLNRLEDIDDIYITRKCETGSRDFEFREARTIKKDIIRRKILIGPDEQSILIPLCLLLCEEWEFEIPCVTPSAQYMGAVSVNLYGMGVPDQTWSTSFSSGQNISF